MMTSPPVPGAPMQRFGWVREIVAGMSTSIVTLPVCMSAGLLAYRPFGPDVGAFGSAAGLLGATAGGFVAALVAPPSFMISSPRVSVALVQASLAAALVTHEPFVGNLPLDVLAMAICLLLAGLLQIGFGRSGLASVIKFTPHPVLAGFANGVALLIVIGAFNIVQRGAVLQAASLCALAFAVALTTLILYVPRLTKRAPPSFVGLAAGTVVFYGLRLLVPDLPLGPTVGSVTLHIAMVPHAAMAAAGDMAPLAAAAPEILLTSLVLAVVGSLDSLLAARVVRDLSASPSRPAALLVAQGIGNAAAAAVGGAAIAIAPPTTMANFRAGGRTRLSALASAAILFLIVIFVPWLVGAVPLVVLGAILFSAGILMFDRWSVRLLRDGFGRRTKGTHGSTWKNLAVIVVVMVVTVSRSVSAGVLTGVVLSCLIFIIDMARPLVFQRHRGDVIFSRRVRPERDGEILRRTGHQRLVLELQGVMFFGNADDLCEEIGNRFRDIEMVLLDLRRVTDIDVSAIGSLQQAAAKARLQKKALLFCSVPPAHRGLLESLNDAKSVGAVFDDVDAALEWMEEEALCEAGRSEFEEIPLEQIEFLQGLAPDEFQAIKKYLMPMAFPAGTILCRQGEDADYLWILSSGSVSIWVGGQYGQLGRRIAALARGTIVGEMALLESGPRSATVRADEDVTGYMIDRETFDTILQEHPHTGRTLLTKMAREMARRLRLSQEAASRAGGTFYGATPQQKPAP